MKRSGIEIKIPQKVISDFFFFEILVRAEFGKGERLGLKNEDDSTNF